MPKRVSDNFYNSTKIADCRFVAAPLVLNGGVPCINYDGCARAIRRMCTVHLIQSILTKGSRCKLNEKKTIAHDDVTWRATSCKLLKKIIDLATIP